LVLLSLDGAWLWGSAAEEAADGVGDATPDGTARLERVTLGWRVPEVSEE
jgi:hypothetical protein